MGDSTLMIPTTLGTDCLASASWLTEGQLKGHQVHFVGGIALFCTSIAFLLGLELATISADVARLLAVVAYPLVLPGLALALAVGAVV